MPRSSEPRITKGHAASLVVRLYLREPDVLAELHQLREDHLELPAELVARQAGFSAKCRTVLTTEEYQKMIRDLYGLHATQGRIPNLPASLTCQLERIKQIGHNWGPSFAVCRNCLLDGSSGRPGQALCCLYTLCMIV
jgi:hypothetical protein